MKQKEWDPKQIWEICNLYFSEVEGWVDIGEPENLLKSSLKEIASKFYKEVGLFINDLPEFNPWKYNETKSAIENGNDFMQWITKLENKYVDKDTEKEISRKKLGLD